jgi:hypothetical protein
VKISKNIHSHADNLRLGAHLQANFPAFGVKM